MLDVSKKIYKEFIISDNTKPSMQQTFSKFLEQFEFKRLENNSAFPHYVLVNVMKRMILASVITNSYYH